MLNTRKDYTECYEDTPEGQIWSWWKMWSSQFFLKKWLLSRALGDLKALSRHSRGGGWGCYVAAAVGDRGEGYRGPISVGLCR